jgi:beta-lactam-binding protein with PASTA domain
VGYGVKKTRIRDKGYDRGTVIDQEPAPGTPATPGSVVTITIVT